MKKGGSTEREREREGRKPASQPAGQRLREGPKNEKREKELGPIFVREKDDG